MRRKTKKFSKVPKPVEIHYEDESDSLDEYEEKLRIL